MKKLLLFILGTVFSFTAANAQVTSAAGYFGTYKFTADMEVTEAGKALESNFSNDCEVVIDETTTYDASITGFAGAPNAVAANWYSSKPEELNIKNPNGTNSYTWPSTTSIAMSDAEGSYPFGVFSDFILTADADGNFTMDNFTLVKYNHSNSSAEILATFTNCKLTLVKKKEIDIIDLSGDWHYSTSTGIDGAEIPMEFDMTLTATSDDFKNYDATIAIEGCDPLSLKGVFDGVNLSLPFDSVTYVINGEKKVSLHESYGIATYNNRKGSISFVKASETSMSLDSYLIFAQETVSETTGRDTLVTVQYYWYGSARKASTETIDFAGTYSVSCDNLYIEDGAPAFPTEFDMTIVWSDDMAKFYVTNILGKDIYNLTYGGLPAVPNAENPRQLDITVGNKAYIQFKAETADGGWEYYCLYDKNGSNTDNVTLTLNEDGTWSMSGFSLAPVVYGSSEAGTMSHFYDNCKVTKAAALEPIDLNGVFTVTADVEVVKENGVVAYPEKFDVAFMTAYSIWEEKDVYYMIEFFGSDKVYSLNNGGIALTPSADDANVQTLALDKYLAGGGGDYLRLRDINGETTGTVAIVTNPADGTITMSDFSVYFDSFNTDEKYLGAKYTNVKLVRKDTVEFSGNYVATFDEFTAVDTVGVGFDFPTESFNAILTHAYVDYMEEWYDNVIGFLGVDQIYGGGPRARIDAKDPGEYNVPCGGTIKTIYPYGTDGDNWQIRHGLLLSKLDGLATDSLKFSANYDGTWTVEDFAVVVSGKRDTAYVAATYKGVTLTPKTEGGEESAIEAVEANDGVYAADGVIYIKGEATYVEVYNSVGMPVYRGVATEVRGLNRGIYFVRTGKKSTAVIL